MSPERRAEIVAMVGKKPAERTGTGWVPFSRLRRPQLVDLAGVLEEQRDRGLGWCRELLAENARLAAENERLSTVTDEMVHVAAHSNGRPCSPRSRRPSPGISGPTGGRRSCSRSRIRCGCSARCGCSSIDATSSSAGPCRRTWCGRSTTEPAYTPTGSAGSTNTPCTGTAALGVIATTRCPLPQPIHPTEKPLGILLPLIEYACPPGGSVLDPFGGSGSTAEAARQSGRTATLIEADERYCEVIARRLSQGVLV